MKSQSRSRILAVLAVAGAFAVDRCLAQAPICPGQQSLNVAFISGPSVINGGTYDTSGAAFAGMTFANLSPAQVDAAHLAAFDTVVLNVASPQLWCNINSLSATAKAALVEWVGQGHKLIIGDSECSSQDYSWLPYPFVTSNPGAMGASGEAVIVEENTLSSSDATSPYYVDMYKLSWWTDAVGDANVMVTLDPNWNIDMTAKNYLNDTGPVHTYAEYSGGGGLVGLIIYNGFDKDYQGWGDPANTLTKMFLLELLQPFNPSCLKGTVTVVGIGLDPLTAENPVGTTHIVTSRVTDQLGNGIAGVEVTFTVVSGPNAGASGTCTPADCKTDASGNISFAYTSNGTGGTDEIVASFVNAAGKVVSSRTVTKTWTSCTAPVVNCKPTTKVSNNPRYYREITATSDCFAAADLDLFVGDSATPGFIAGPFKSGDVLRIAKSVKATVKPGSYGVAAIMTVKGQAILWAVDPDGRVGTSVACP